MTARVHLDTDFGGDPDDACALAFLLGRSDVELVGITTNLEFDGQRAGCVGHYLALAHRVDIPLAAGAEASLTTGRRHRPTWGDDRYWPTPVEPRPAPAVAALDLLRASIEHDATIVAIGAFTNLAQLEIDAPGTLRDVPVVAMAGWLDPPPSGYPQWGPAMDWNVQCDTRAAAIVAEHAELTLVTLPAAMRAQLRAPDLPRLRAAGRVGELLAQQSGVYAADRNMPALEPDLVNFHWDPVTCAVALGWDGATTITRQLGTTVDGDGVLAFCEIDDGRPTRVVTDLDGEAFAEVFLSAVEAIEVSS